MIFNNFGFNAQGVVAAAAPGPPEPINDSVIFWLDPANPASYNGGNITTGTGNTGRTWNSVSGSSTAPFNIFRFSGGLTTTGSWFTTNLDIRLQTTAMVPNPPSSSWTIEAWVNMYSSNFNSGNIMTATFGGGGQTRLNYNLGNGLTSANYGARPAAQGVINSTQLIGSGPIPDTLIGQGWKHVVGTASTANNGTYTVYINGVIQVQTSNQGLIGGNTSNTAYTFINHDVAQNGGNYNASWGQMRFYSRPLTQAEIQYNFNLTKGIYGVT